MKSIIIILFLIGVFSSSSTFHQQPFFEAKCYESDRGPLYVGNQFCFYSNNSYKYTGYGPAVFISWGNWEFKNSSNEIELFPNRQNITFNNRVDTRWIDFKGKTIKVKNKKQLLFENLIFKLK